jgi:glutamyl-tRNA synthetase
LSREESEARKSEPHTIRFKIDDGTLSFKDHNFGHVQQDMNDGDFIVLKSDGYPTYHLANVVDDRKMEISHVIRGQEWLASTPKHISLYE